MKNFTDTKAEIKQKEIREVEDYMLYFSSRNGPIKIKIGDMINLDFNNELGFDRTLKLAMIDYDFSNIFHIQEKLDEELISINFEVIGINIMGNGVVLIQILDSEHSRYTIPSSLVEVEEVSELRNEFNQMRFNASCNYSNPMHGRS